MWLNLLSSAKNVNGLIITILGLMECLCLSSGASSPQCARRSPTNMPLSRLPALTLTALSPTSLRPLSPPHRLTPRRLSRRRASVVITAPAGDATAAGAGAEWCQPAPSTNPSPRTERGLFLMIFKNIHFIMHVLANFS